MHTVDCDKSHETDCVHAVSRLDHSGGELPIASKEWQPIRPGGSFNELFPVTAIFQQEPTIG